VDAAAKPVIEHPVTFADPPVNEVVLSIQFASVASDDALLLAEFWPRIKDRFPRIERQPPIAGVIEDFSSPPKPAPVEIEFAPQGLPLRYWCISELGNDLIQFQKDRFLVNWRKQGEEIPYPRYEHVREGFAELAPIFQEAVSPTSPLEIIQCEITYINEISARPESGFGHMELNRVLRLFKDQLSLEAVPPAEDTQFQSRHVLRRQNNEPYGRFYIGASPGFRNLDSAPIYGVTLMARGLPPTPDLEGALSFFDDGHDRIVRTFKEITTADMHVQWGLEES
jgi:uncharacterized protein (TIGR04255 family)